MLKQIEGIVLKSKAYGETHKLMTIFTKDAGKISAISRGANKPKSRLSAVSQMFIRAEFLLYYTKGLSTVQQGQITDSYRQIREDIIKTAYASYIIELTDKILETRQPDPYIYGQLQQTLTWINNEDDFMIPLIMLELKLYEKGGFAPILDRCVSCGNDTSLSAFSIGEGGLLCTSCRSLDPSAVSLNNALMKLLPILLHVPLDRVGNISVKLENQQLIRKLLDHYYDQYGGFQLKSKRFLSQINLLE